jgi:hypothetical protein
MGLAGATTVSTCVPLSHSGTHAILFVSTSIDPTSHTSIALNSRSAIWRASALLKRTSEPRGLGKKGKP